MMVDPAIDGPSLFPSLPRFPLPLSVGVYLKLPAHRASQAGTEVPQSCGPRSRDSAVWPAKPFAKRPSVPTVGVP